MPEYQLLIGDCVERMAEMPDSSVDSIVTDPPYGLGFMGKKWDIGVPAVDVFLECLRVLKPGGHLLAFGGSRTYHRLAVAVEDAGFEIRDQIMWVYGSGFPKSRNVGKDVDGWDGWGTALKPAHEPIVVARKPFKATVAANVLTHGTGALNIDGCRVETDENLGGGACAENGGRTESQSLHGGSGMNQPGKTVGRSFEQPTGRWPANVIHDGSDEVVALFPHTSSGKMKAGTRRATQDGPGSVCYGTYGGDATAADTYADAGSAARFFYCAKASRRDRNEGLDDMPDAILARSCQAAAEAKRGNTVGQAAGAFNRARVVKNNHPTVKPIELMRYLCRLVTPPGGTVLDPFAGSGSTGKAAMREGFDFIGIEKEAEYLPIIRARLEHAQTARKVS